MDDQLTQECTFHVLLDEQTTLDGLLKERGYCTLKVANLIWNLLSIAGKRECIGNGMDEVDDSLVGFESVLDRLM